MKPMVEEKAAAMAENRPELNLAMHFHYEPSSDPPRYNSPTCTEIAAVFETTDRTLPSHRCISVYARDEEPKNIDHDRIHCDPMSYALSLSLWGHRLAY